MNQAPPPWSDFTSTQEREIASLIGPKSRRPLAGSRAALLVVDVVYSFTGSSSVPLQEAIAEFPTGCGERAWESLPNIATLIERFRSSSRPVIFTRPDHELVHHAGQTTTLDSQSVSTTAAAYANEFHPSIEPAPGDLVLPKPRASAFFATPLSLVLARNGIDTVVVVGGSTSGCVRATAVDASSNDFEVFVVADACFDRFDASHAVSLFDLHAKYGTVLTTDEVHLQKV